MYTKEELMHYVGKYVNVFDGQGRECFWSGFFMLHKRLDLWGINSGSELHLGVPNIFFENSISKIARMDKIEETKSKDNSTKLEEPMYLWTPPNKHRIKPVFNILDSWFWNPEQLNQSSITQPSIWNSICPSCGSPAYIGMYSMECSKKCR